MDAGKVDRSGFGNYNRQSALAEMKQEAVAAGIDMHDPDQFMGLCKAMDATNPYAHDTYRRYLRDEAREYNNQSEGRQAEADWDGAMADAVNVVDDYLCGGAGKNLTTSAEALSEGDWKKAGGELLTGAAKAGLAVCGDSLAGAGYKALTANARARKLAQGWRAARASRKAYQMNSVAASVSSTVQNARTNIGAHSSPSTSTPPPGTEAALSIVRPQATPISAASLRNLVAQSTASADASTVGHHLSQSV